MKLCVGTNHGVWRLVAGFGALASARAAEIVVVMEAVVALYSRIPRARELYRLPGAPAFWTITAENTSYLKFDFDALL